MLANGHAHNWPLWNFSAIEARKRWGSETRNFRTEYRERRRRNLRATPEQTRHTPPRIAGVPRGYAQHTKRHAVAGWRHKRRVWQDGRADCSCVSSRHRPCDKLPDGSSAGGTVLVFAVPSLPRHPPRGAAIRLLRLEAAAATAAKGGYWARIHLGRTDRQQFGFGCSQPHRLTAWTPLASRGFKHAMAARTTFGTSAVRRQMPRRDVVPVAADQQGVAAVTMCSLTSRIVDIASIDIAKACIHGDAPRHAQRLHWCRQGVHQLPVRMEGREM